MEAEHISLGHHKMKKLFLHFQKKVKSSKHNQAWCSTIKKQAQRLVGQRKLTFKK
jgi:hypothetical protein